MPSLRNFPRVSVALVMPATFLCVLLAAACSDDNSESGVAGVGGSSAGVGGGAGGSAGSSAGSRGSAGCVTVQEFAKIQAWVQGGTAE
jgi:hypothetical protein